MGRHRPELQRFFERVAIGDGCWRWTGAVNVRRHGYGMWAFRGETKTFAHRAMWRLAFGPIPKGLWILHHCDNPVCVRPDHLYVGTAKDNRQDAVIRRRGSTKLEADQVREIRKRRVLGETLDALALAFGVSQTTIAKIVHGRGWTHIEGPIEAVSRHPVPTTALLHKQRALLRLKVIAERLEAGETQRQIADDLGVTPPRMSELTKHARRAGLL